MISAAAVLVGLLGFAMIFPAMADFSVNNSDWQVFAVSGIGIVFSSILVFSATRSPNRIITRREIFVFVAVIWFVYSAVAAIPLVLADLKLSMADAFFEAASGFTTTGSTVLVGLDDLPPGILLWRSIMQWIGGLGIVVLGISLLPFMRIGGQQLFSLESSDKSDKPFPQIKQYTERLALIYVIISLACAASYMALGMSAFEAINHAMATISTGGYSTSDASMGHFGSTPLLAISTFFMFLGGLPFIFLIRLSGGTFEWDKQISYFLALIGLSSFIIILFRSSNGTLINWDVLVSVVFNVTSVLTTTGFASEDYLKWGSETIVVIFFITFIGACAGSTAGGFKMFRLIVIKQILVEGLTRMFSPNQVIVLKYGKKRITPQVASSVLMFTLLYLATFMVFAILYGFIGLDIDTALSGSITALANVGPGIGNIIGPAGNFSSLPDSAKWLLGIEMIIGRLEILGIMVLLIPAFWKS